VGSTYVISAAILLHAVWAILPVPRHLDMIANEIPGWKQLGRQVDAVHAAMPEPSGTFIFGMKYQIASELAFYVPGNPRTVSINRFDRPNVYDYWWEDKDLIGMDAVGVTEGSKSHLIELPRVFDRVDAPIPVVIRSRDGASVIRTFYVYRAYGFKGGLRWVPPDRRDIRASG
jgi:undecaprenyl-diphosphatase